MSQECLKQVVHATIFRYGTEISTGSNSISNDEVTECPRVGMETGEGYHLCKEVCGQSHHAEISALVNAGDQDLTDCYIVLEGHTYVCDNCMSALKERGLTRWRTAYGKDNPIC
jgi:deoxycytidylate deaminase